MTDSFPELKMKSLRLRRHIAYQGANRRGKGNPKSRHQQRKTKGLQSSRENFKRSSKKEQFNYKE